MFRLLILSLSITCASCAGTSGRPIPVTLDIEVAADANPDDRGRPSPVVLSTFDLARSARFTNSDYVTLLSAPQRCLRDDLLGQHRTRAIVPGTRHTFTFALEPNARYVGVIAELMQFSDVRTRIDIPLRRFRSNRISVRIDSNGIAQQDDQRDRNENRHRFNDD